jgi:lysophospholipase L1-like esterase
MTPPIHPWLQPNQKVVCFGDSITAAPEGYVKILQEKLAPQNIQVINSGIGGNKTPQALARLQTDVIAHQPPAVSLFFGTNDAVIGHGQWSAEPTISPEAYRANLVWIIHLCRQHGIHQFSITPPLWWLEGPAWQEFGDVFPPYCQAARDAAEEMKAYFVPADLAFAEEWARHPGHTGLLLTKDGVHPNQRGNQILAEATLRGWGMA